MFERLGFKNLFLKGKKVKPQPSEKTAAVISSYGDKLEFYGENYGVEVNRYYAQLSQKDTGTMLNCHRKIQIFINRRTQVAHNQICDKIFCYVMRLPPSFVIMQPLEKVFKDPLDLPLDLTLSALTELVSLSKKICLCLISCIL